MTKIPKIIHYCWVGGNPKPQSVLYCIESWKRCCPDYEIREWNETNYDFTKNEYMRQAYEAKNGASSRTTPGWTSSTSTAASA